ncbi:OmpA family protein [Thioalkalicoccus limnaeus]|uniref:OmpA family protein n=1 Tax=Thioalkalicoccus limnaeus TaxID=120681 RepID=A0ABV4BFU1_9GAMM
MTPTQAKTVAIAAACALALAGCATNGQPRGMTETGTGALIGAATGAAIGALVTDKSAKGALIGAVGGAIAGGMVGSYMENQRQDFERALRDEIAAGVVRVETLPNDQLLVGMTGATAFETDSDVIKPGFYSTMNKISHIVQRYGKTQLAIGGHTDSTGTVAHNQQLSERRAASVQRYLLADGVLPQRMSATGYGQHYPIASNQTPEGRRLNRRVDIIIIPITAG